MNSFYWHKSVKRSLAASFRHFFGKKMAACFFNATHHSERHFELKNSEWQIAIPRSLNNISFQNENASRLKTFRFIFLFWEADQISSPAAISILQKSRPFISTIPFSWALRTADSVNSSAKDTTQLMYDQLVSALSLFFRFSA